MKFLFVFLVFGLIASSISAKIEAADKKIKPCPTFKPAGNLNNSKTLDDVQDDLFENLWDADEPKLTKGGNKFKDIIFDLRESGISKFESYALAVTILSWSYIPQMSTRPDLSGYVNLTIAESDFIANNGTPKCNFIRKSLNDVKPSFIEALNLALDTAVENSKCNATEPEKKDKKEKKIKVPSRNDDVWENDGWVYPAKWQDISQRMTDSSNVNNKVLGLFSEVLVSPAVSGIVDSIDKYYLYQLFAMSGTEELPKKCCDAFLKDQRILRQKIPGEINEAVKNYRQSLSCP